MDDGDMINGLLVDTHCIAIIYSAPPLTALTQRAMNACNVIFASPTPERGQSLGKFSEWISSFEDIQPTAG